MSTPSEGQYVNIPFGTSEETVLTLESFLAQWAAGAITEPAALAGTDPVAQAQQMAAERCAVIPTPDCAQAASLAQQYGSMVAAAIVGYTYTPPPATTTTTTTTPPPTTYTPPPATTTTTTTPPPTTYTPPPAATTTTTAPPPTTTLTSRAPQAEFIDAGAVAGVDAGGDVGSAAAGAVTFGVSIVVTILGALFGGLFGNGEVKQLQQDVQNLRNALAQTADELERFSWSIAYGLGKLWQAVAYIWDNFLDSIWSWLKQLWKLLWCIVDTIIPKIINVLRDLRKFLDDIYVKYILPAMRYLLYVRQVLAILRALGLPFGSKLDKILTQIQGALFAPFLYLLRSLNGYGGWFNFMLTSGLTLQRPLFINTMYAYQADWINMFWASQAGQLGPVGVLGPAAQGTSSFAAAFGPGGTDGSSTDTTAQVMTVAEACSWIAVFAATGSGELADTAQATLAALNQQLGI